VAAGVDSSPNSSSLGSNEPVLESSAAAREAEGVDPTGLLLLMLFGAGLVGGAVLGVAGVLAGALKARRLWPAARTAARVRDTWRSMFTELMDLSSSRWAQRAAARAA
jgi:hypothetical protein